MGIIVFLVDTSASMNQRTYAGVTLLDIAKGAVETFVKMRSRIPNNLDRYMLVTFDEPPFCIKSGWKESLATFTTELKYMKACGTSTLGVALKETFDLLNLPRASSNTDTYGAGRNATIQEPAVIIAFTDVGRMHTGASHVTDQLELPMTNSIFGAEMTKEPFRWDQRLFSLMLRIPGHNPPMPERPPRTYTEVELNLMSEATGGKAYTVTSPKVLQQCLDSIALKVHHTGVVLKFEKQAGVEPAFTATGLVSDTAAPLNGGIGLGDEPMDLQDDSNSASAAPTNGVYPASRGESPRTVGKATALRDEDTGDPGRGDTGAAPAAEKAPAWHSCLRMIYVKHDPRTLPPRPHWPIPEAFWQDSSMTTLPPRKAHPVITFSCVANPPQTVNKLPFDKYEMEPSALTQYLLQNKPPNICWQVFVENSSRASGLGRPFGYLKTSINGNCVSLFVMPYNYPELFPLLDEIAKQKFKPNHVIMTQFNRYVHSLPAYYITPLRNALLAFGGRPAAALVGDGMIGLNPGVDIHLNSMKKQGKDLYDKVCVQLTRRCNKTEAGETNSPYPVKEKIKLQTYRNPFDISRVSLVDQVARMRKNMSMALTTSRPRLQDEEDRHSLPVVQTGNYQEHLKRINPLRDIDVSISGESKTQLFGNPFRLESKGRGLGLDEANEAMMGVGDSPGKRSGSPPGGASPKRRAMSPRSQRFSNTMQRVSSLACYAPPGSPSPVLSTSDPASPSPVATTGASAMPGKLALPSTAIPPTPSLGVQGQAGAIPAGPLSLKSNSSSVAEPGVSSPSTAGVHARPGQDGNNMLKTQMMKEVRKPGKGADRVLDMLGELKGGTQERAALAKDIRKEALRFKRHKLVAQIDSWIQGQYSSENAYSSS